MMEEGVNMIKELIKIKENNNIVSIFCDEDDTSMFLEGYIYAIGRQDFLIKHITPHGLADGYILKKIDSVMHLEISGQYEKKIEKLYSKKNQRHIDLKLQDKVSLKNNIFQICMNNKYIVSIEMIQDDECPIKGVINKIDDNKVIVSKLTEYGEDDGEAILKKENIDTISFLGVDEEDIQLLKSGLTELGTSVLPILTSSSLKTEKNYTVIILEKLASLAIQVGKDIVSVIRLRNFYIKKVEEQTEFVGVLATRDSAIIHFTEELHGVSNQARTSLIRCVLQYINLKIYDNIKVTELAKQFYLSESALRSRFKEEIGVPINEYVNKRKIEESKMMIWSGIPAGEIARRLSFYDLSHYYRTFKKYTGVTPQQFRDTNIIGQEM